MSTDHKLLPPRQYFTVLACTADFRPTWPGAPDHEGWSIFDQQTRVHQGDPLYDNERNAVRYMWAIYRQTVLLDIP